jgi:hypothetical protein
LVRARRYADDLAAHRSPAFTVFVFMPQLSRTTWYALIAAALIAAAIAYSLTGPDTADEAAPANTPSASKAGAGPSRVAAGAPRAASAAWPVMVSDAMGLTLDAARLFELGFAGGVVIDADTRAAIEAIINSMPEDPSADDLARLERTLREGLPREDAEKALALFTNYRAYTGEVQREVAPKGIPANMQEANAMFDQMEAMKRRHFGEATANALFGQHDAHARITMEAMFVAQDASLTPAQKKTQLDALRARLPADQQSLIPQPEAEAASQPSS